MIASKNENRIGWIRGDKAKTIEDMEHLVQLEEQVKELEKELESYHGSQKILSIHKECEEEISLFRNYSG